MTGNEFLKMKREECGYSVRKFAVDIGVSPRTISYHESGEKRIGSISLNKCICMFRRLDIPVCEFFDLYYPYKHSIDEKKKQWAEQNLRTYNFGLLKKRLYLRLAQIKKRKRLGEKELEEILVLFEAFFKDPQCPYSDGDDISPFDYEKYVRPIYYKIKIGMNGLPSDEIGRTIIDALYKTDFSISDVAAICDITKQHLNLCINGNFDFGAMHVYTALKLCYLLELDFEEIFVKKIN